MISATTPTIRQRTKGQRHGAITRFMSPHDLGEKVKPFIFLDYFEMNDQGGKGFPTHPHSGIATHTTMLSGQFKYWDSTGKQGVLGHGDIEWMQAGGGVWHGGHPLPGEPIKGYQLWVSLPSPLELAPAESHYVDAEFIGTDGPARILLGSYGNLKSRIAYGEPLTYLHVALADGQSWEYQVPEGHDVAWLATHAGRLHVAGEVLQREMAVFADGTDTISMRAEGPTEWVIGSARKHPHPLISGYYSVHTREDALVEGESGIIRLGQTEAVRALRRMDKA